MKKLSLVLLSIAAVMCFNAKSKAQFLNVCNADSIRDLPKMLAGQPYFQILKPSGHIDSVVITPLVLSINFIAASDITITGLPAGFTVTKSYYATINQPPSVDSLLSCIVISAPASAVDAAIANSPNGDGVYELQYSLGSESYIHNADPNSPLLANYTWTSTLGSPAISSTLMLGQNSGSSPCTNTFFYNGDSTYYAGLPSTAGSYTINVYNSYVNCPNFTVSSSCNWLTATPQYSTNGDGTITINYDANPTDSARYCDLTIGSTIYHITQIEPDCNVAMSINNSVVGPLDGTIYVTVTAADTCYWSILNRDFCDWVDINPQSGMGTQVVEISYANNNTNQVRSCDINISGETIHLEQQSPLAVQEQGISVFNLYPNPANDFVTISVPNTNGKEVLSIYTVAGQLLLQTQLTATQQQVSTTNLANGIYVFTLVNAQGNISRKKVIISR